MKDAVRIFILLDFKFPLVTALIYTYLDLQGCQPLCPGSSNAIFFLKTKASGNRKYFNFMEQNGRKLPETQFSPGFNIDTQNILMLLTTCISRFL